MMHSVYMYYVHENRSEENGCIVYPSNFDLSHLESPQPFLWPFFRDHPGELVPEQNLCTSWCNGRLTEADTPTIRLSATPSGLNSAHLHHPSH